MCSATSPHNTTSNDSGAKGTWRTLHKPGRRTVPQRGNEAGRAQKTSVSTENSIRFRLMSSMGPPCSQPTSRKLCPPRSRRRGMIPAGREGRRERNLAGSGISCPLRHQRSRVPNAGAHGKLVLDSHMGVPDG
jgi:hypothetical protein